MPRKVRLDTPGTLRYVMIRGLQKRKIFWDDQDRGDFLSRLVQRVEKPGDRIVAWTIMENHVFLIVQWAVGYPLLCVAF
jgi:REP element-mobilizing transposase RayT